MLSSRGCRKIPSGRRILHNACRQTGPCRDLCGSSLPHSHRERRYICLFETLHRSLVALTRLQTVPAERYHSSHLTSKYTSSNTMAEYWDEYVWIVVLGAFLCDQRFPTDQVHQQKQCSQCPTLLPGSHNGQKGKSFYRHDFAELYFSTVWFKYSWTLHGITFVRGPGRGCTRRRAAAAKPRSSHTKHIYID